MERKDWLTYAWGVAKLSCSVACLSLRLLEKKETLSTALQRLGWSSIERRNGPVLWFNVGGMGETSTVLPVVYRCLQEYNEKVTVLVTTSCMEVYQVLGKSLPHRVLVQLVPLENPITVALFLRKWQPQIGVFMETPFQRELALMARKRGVRLALLNAHLPGEDMLVWHAHRTSREILKQMLSSYSLIVPRTYVDVGRFRMFGATLGQMPGWSTDLQQASELGACATCFLEPRPKIRRSLLRRLGERQLWIAANTLPDEDTVVARIHATLRSRHKALLTVVAPRVAPTSNSNSSNSYAEAARRLSSQKRLKVVMLSAAVQNPHRLSTDVDVLVLDDPEVLTSLYSLSEIVLVGGSLMPSPDGASSPAIAAVASCALLMGPHGAEYLGLAVDLNHAAIMASEEVAAAVAQTGVTMRGVNPGGLETPRDAADAPAGRGETSGRWLGWGSGVDVAARMAGYGRLFGPASVEAGCAASESRAHGRALVSRRNRGWFMQSMERTARPMSAPATVPEYFHLRVPTPSSALSACGFSSISHEASSGTAGARDVLVAPFSGSGVTYSRVSLGLPTDCTDAITAQGNRDFALSRSALDVAGTDSKQRHAIDRFRWAANREVIGFGYTSPQDARSDSSASSTCDSEEWAKVEVDEGKGACNVKSTSAATNNNSSLSAACYPVLWSLDESGDECDALTVPQDETGPNLMRDPSQTILPESKMPEKATDVVPPIEMAVAAPLSPKVLAALGTLPLFTACASDAGLSAQRDGDAASHVDERDFHDVVETQEVQPAYHGQGTRERAPGPVGDSVPGIESGATTGSVLIGELAVGPDPSNGQELQPGPGGANQQIAGASSMYIPPNNASLEDRAGRRVVQQAVDQVTRVQAPKAEVEAAAMADAAFNERRAAMATAVKTSPKQQPGDTAQSSPPPHADARDVLQRQKLSGQGDCVGVAVSESPASGHGATHKIHLVMCGDVDSDNDEVEWLPRQRFCEARHLTSDPGVASSEFRCCGDERRGFSLDWPAPSAKSLVVAFHSSQGNTESDEDIESTAAIILPGRAHQSGPSAPIPPERPHSRALACLDDDIMTETWASDVSLAAIIESCKDCSSSHPSQLLSQSQPDSSMTHEASGVWADVLASPRSSLDCLEAMSQHTLVASLPSSDISRFARGSLASRTLAETSNATNMTDVLHPEVMEVAAGTHVQGLKSVGEEDYGDEGSEVVTSGVGHLQLDGGANASLLPQNVQTDVPVAGASNSLDERVKSGEPWPTDYAAAVVFPSADLAEVEEPMMEPSPKNVSSVSSCGNCASSSRADPPHNLTVGVSAFLLSDLCADVHGSCATDSPKSDFEFGGSVPDDTGSGSPTLLASTSAHNGSGANIQASANTASPESTAASQSQDSVSAATSDAALIRQSSRINSPVANDSLCGPAPQVSAPGATLYLSHAAATAVPVPPRIQSQAPSSGSSTAESNTSYNAGTCFGRQAPFPWLGDGGVPTMPSAVAPTASTSVARSPSGAGSGDSGSTAVTGASPGMYHTLAASFSSSMSGTSISSSSSDLPPFHQVASIGSWLDHFGCMLPQPSHGLQRSQVQHDPMIWFNEHESIVPAAALEDVASGLRAPMHSPLRPFDDEYLKPGIQPQALACVSTTLFPAAPPPISYPAPLPPPASVPISPSAPSRVTTTAAAKSAGAGDPSALLRTASFISSEQVTSAFSMSRSQCSILPHARADAPTAPAQVVPDFISAFASEQYPVKPVASLAGMADTPTNCSTRDELSALLNSPSSPVSPVRITHAVSPMMNCRPAQRGMDSLGFPAATPNTAGYIPPRSPSAGFSSSLLLSPARLPRQQQAAPTSTAAVGSAAGHQVEGGVCPVPLLVKSINTPQRRIKRMMSMHLECSSPLSPQRSSITVVPGSNSAVHHIFGGHGLEVDYDAATAGLWHCPSSIAAAAGAVAPTSADNQPESPCGSGSSSCPTTPRSRVAENASSPFLSPMERALCAVTRGDDMSFEESFEAVVSATPRRSPAWSATGCASAHMSPYSLLYRQSLAGDMGPSLDAHQGQSLYEEEQEELASGEDGGLWQELEDSDIGMPLSPRAHRQNVLFSPHMPRDDDVNVAAGPILMAAVPSYVQLPISELPSVFAQRISVTPSPATNRLPYGSGGAVTSGITPACEVPGIADPTTATVTYGATSLLVRPASTDSRIATSIIMSSIADIALADGSVAAPDGITTGHNLPSSSSANLESVPTFSLMHTDDDEKSTDASAARGNFPRPLEAHPGRQPRITLSGGPLILSAVCHGSLGSHNLSTPSNLSELSNPHNLIDEEPGGKETMQQPSVVDTAALAPEEPSYHLSNPGGSKQSSICIREAEIDAANGNTTPRASPYSVDGSTETGSVDSLVSSSLAVLAVDPEDSPPCSSAERTSCPRGACPSASPVELLPLSLASSSPVPCSLATDASQRTPLQLMGVLSSQTLDGSFQPLQSPLSPMRSPRVSTSAPAGQGLYSRPTPYMSLRATDLRTSPIKVMTAVKRTAGDTLPRAVEDVQRVLPYPLITGGSVVGHATTNNTPAACFAPLAPALDHLFPTAALNFSGMVPALNAVSPAIKRASPTTQLLSPTSPRHRSSAHHLQAWGLRDAGIVVANDKADNEGALLGMRASCPAGFAGFADCSFSPKPKFGQRGGHPTLSPSTRDTGAPSHELHAQRNHQQQMWDRARAESRNTSAAGTPRSARKLFHGYDGSVPEVSPPSPSFTVTYSDVCVSPVDAPRFPRAATPGPTMFTINVAPMTVSSGGAVPSESVTDEVDKPWSLQQARPLLQVSSGQGTTHHSPVLSSPGTPEGHTSAAGQVGVAVAQPSSPKCGQVLWMPVSDGSTGSNASRGDAGINAGSASSALGRCSTPHRHSSDQLDQVLAHMTVQVASPVSPQPRLPSPAASARSALYGSATGDSPCCAAGAKANAAVVTTSRTSTSGVEPTRFKDASSSRQASVRLPSALLQQSRRTSGSRKMDIPHGLPPCGGTTASPADVSAGAAPWEFWGLLRGAGPGALCSPDAAVGTQWQRVQHSGDNGTDFPAPHAMLPTLTQLPLLPRLRNLPMIRSSLDSAHTSLPRSATMKPNENSGAKSDLPRAATAEAVQRQRFRGSAPELSHAFGPLLPQTSATASGSDHTLQSVMSMSLPGVSTVAEQKALASLESQFMAAELEASELPIETRVVTPTALPGAADSYNSSGSGVAVSTRGAVGGQVKIACAGVPGSQAGRSGTVPDKALGQLATLPSPRSTAPRASLSLAAAANREVSPLDNAGDCGDAIANKARSPLEALFEAGTGGSSTSRAGPITMGAETAMPTAGGRQPSLMRLQSSPTIGTEAGAPSLCNQRPGSGGQRCVEPRPPAISSSGPNHSVQQDGPALVTPTRTGTDERGAAIGSDCSPQESLGAGRRVERELHTAPCARYADKYLLPAAHLTRDTRVGPAVWIVSDEDELVTALNRLLLDSIERQSRGRAAAQGAAKLASSLVSTVWGVLEDMVIAPALQEYVSTSGGAREIQ